MSLEDAVKSESHRVQLEGVRDLLVKELEGNRCKSCASIKLRMSDTASMVGKLIGVLKELNALPSEQEEAEVDPVEAILDMAVGENILPFDHSERQKTRRKRDE